MASQSNNRLRARQRFGKYRIIRMIGEGGFARVYQAHDTVEAREVALKVPKAEVLADASLEAKFQKEIRLAAKFEHPRVLGIKNAEYIDGVLVLVSALGQSNLKDRLRHRMAMRTRVAMLEQMLEGVAAVHQTGSIHCDIKPDNFILFEGGELKLADFGIARSSVVTETLEYATGTLGYLAPEQALGRPRKESDVFSLGLCAWELFGGRLPSWPYALPFNGAERVRKHLTRDGIEWLTRACALRETSRYRDAGVMLRRYKRSKRFLFRSL